MKRIAILCFILVTLVGYASAFGVVGDYSRDNILKMYPGENKQVTYTIQNMVGEEDIKIMVNLKEGENIARISGQNTYDVPYGSANTEVPVIVSIPENAPVGQKYNVVAEFRTVTEGGEGVVIGLGIDYPFGVEVIEKASEEKEESNLWIVAIILAFLVIIIVVVILIILYTKRKKSDEAVERPKLANFK